MRIGHGIDVHRLTEGRPLIIGGVNIPYEKGLAGHSDADVLLHAVMDALLGAAALGDIGKHFPDTDPSFKGADSMELLKRVGKIIDNSGYEIINIDSTIRAQRPKMASHIDNMRSNIASALCIDSSQVSVKATTEEHLGFTGREEGIAAEAVCLIKKKKDKAEKKSEKKSDKKKGKKSDKRSEKKSEKKSDKKSAEKKSSDTKGKIEL